MDQHDNRRDSKTYNRDRLFEAVASRDISKLDGLQEYLRQNMKKLSDSLCECWRTGNATAATKVEHADLCVNHMDLCLHPQIGPTVKRP